MGLSVPFNLPAGSISQYAGSTAPPDWLFMYGQAVSRTTYAALFAAIGTTYGVGDGSTTFNLPDARGRVLFGKDDMGGVAANRLTTGGGGVDGVALGAVGGGQSVTLTEAQMPSHAHVHNSHAHNINVGSSLAAGISGEKSGSTQQATTGVVSTEQAKGSSSAHGNIPPALVINYIIKV